MPNKVNFKKYNTLLIRPINLRGKEVTTIDILEISFLGIDCFFPDLDIFPLPDKSEILYLLEENSALFNLKIEHLDELITHLNNCGNARPSLLYFLESFIIKKNQNHLFRNKVNVLSSGFYNQDQNLIKLKVTKNNFEDVIKKIKLIQTTKVRLDGNQSLTKIELENFLSSLSSEDIKKIEFFEEPCFDINDSKKILNKFSIKFALDEHFSLENLVDADVYILRLREYSLSKLLNIIKENPKKMYVISSSYDLDGGYLANILLAKFIDQFCDKKVAHGLDTANYFNQIYFKNHHKFYELSF